MRRMIVAAAMMAASTGLAAAQTLTLGTNLQLNTMDPHFFNGFPAGSAHPQIFEGLTEISPTLEVKPALATAWRMIDPNTWEFDLREGVRFHDGTPFTARDIIATFARVPNVPNSPALFTPFIRPVKEVQVISDHRIRIITNTPTATLPGDVARVLLLAERDAGQSTSDFNAGRVNGTGPYRFASWTNIESLSITRNDTYWGSRAPWQAVTIRTISRDPSRVAALLAGDVDAIDQVPPADKARIEADPRFRLFSGEAAVVHYIALDSARAESPFVAGRDGQPVPNPLRDRRVRQALSMAIDRTAITERLMESTATPASQFLPSSIDGTSPNLRPTPYDLARARALLTEAGFPQGFRLTLHATTDRYPKDAQIAQAVAQMWTRAGIQAQVAGVAGQVFFSEASRQAYSAFIAQYGTNEAGEGPRAVVHSFEAGRGYGNANRTRYSNPQVDALIQAAMAEIDPDKRREKLHAAIDAAFEDVALIPVFHPAWQFAARRGLVVESRPERRFNALMIRPE
ncbi:ABC transporter substrate-binding protein [Falsiroseomonas bella]|uniref:ABC transporter substrate-binding protein n=1 Tax=Falsiroseomonas bella TaxID=2184016 RepID=A0A317FHI4_9PROT|nr:ABC transporter substrate-binding protein [Falsiroseomonas bella]PWS38053.1 ABC transporter substrate-binding protein [Falsiroseomonas bella]